jgi:hypothetical protein
MPVVWVGQGEFPDERLVAGHQAVRHVTVHQFPAPGQVFRLDVGTVGQDIRVHSSWMALLQRAWNRSVSASCISKSRSEAG